LWALNLSDGSHTLLDIADRSGIQFSVIRDAAAALAAQGLLKETAYISNDPNRRTLQ
jgi:aminopeptidase-like protein